jgi:hypothetical protein
VIAEQIEQIGVTLLVTAKVKSCKFYIANSKLLGSYQFE